MDLCMEDLHVSQKSIKSFFGDMKNKKFIIPEYQRAYKWDIEKCDILWDDFVKFSEENNNNNKHKYFLGSIVSCINDNENKEIIDGQQRITSIMLLLRAFYKKLEGMPSDDDVNGLKSQIAPCIWDINSITQKVDSFENIHINSLVAIEKDNETFHDILKTGTANPENNDNYSKNYIFFQGKCNFYAEQFPLFWKNLCITILDHCAILPIECNDQDSALTIFSTLNDRGLPLEDSDIFKAKLYKKCKNDKERDTFTEEWKQLSQICNGGLISLDDVFRYYMHFIRAKTNDKSKEIALRKFYFKNDNLTRNENLLSDLIELADIWRYININDEDCKPEYLNISYETKKFIHCLKNYPNDFWKYALSVFILKNKKNDNFDHDLLKMIKKLTAFLFVKFIQKPTVNYIKDDIYSSCISIHENNELNFHINFNENEIKDSISNFSLSRFSKALILLKAYLHPQQTALISNNFEIEHILPKKWQTANYNGWSSEDAKKFIEKFGNKIALEKKINIQAGNGYFLKKKEKYKESKIKEVLDISDIKSNDWSKENIEKRDDNFRTIISNFFATQLNE